MSKPKEIDVTITVHRHSEPKLFLNRELATATLRGKKTVVTQDESNGDIWMDVEGVKYQVPIHTLVWAVVIEAEEVK